MPAVNVSVKVIVGGIYNVFSLFSPFSSLSLVGQDKKVEVTSMNRLHKFAQKNFLRQVEVALVFPSRLRFYLPIAGRKVPLSQFKSLISLLKRFVLVTNEESEIYRGFRRISVHPSS